MVDRALLNCGGRTMTKDTTLDTLQPLTREQLVKRIVLLDRVNRNAMLNAERYSQQVAKIGALARAVKRSRVTLADRIALVDAVEELAAHAESEALLDRNCIEHVCSCPPEKWDEMDDQLNDTPASKTKH
jgi:hypothetical protein